ncbi:hypothetical protein GCM10023085_11540 [Actinomadura viridis]|uniref:MinD-like ATPase involved in chromosome partitioning or flagellar assembly n=1 Tax=Actinomadura viridis TaxID=58110 RepID=A0A931GS36_9ACTN|nr:cellulose synthase operon protein YhjQ/BcsQ [Actinomadura viridis]MBG6093531.1 MinD-like ATPase involved in chromosome partitioning or flagellar assembly [Actinomadura viridis]
MSDPDWQHEVLRELGVLESGLIPPVPHPRPTPLDVLPEATARPPEPLAAPVPAAFVPAAAPAPSVPAAELLRRNPHGDPVIRRLGRGVRKAVGASAATGVRDLSELTAQLGAPVRSCRRIAVTSVRGGAGKSSIAALLARLLHQHRDDRVLAIDADPGLGSLPLRLGVTPTRSLRDLTTARPRTWDETTAYLTRTATGLWVIANDARMDLDDNTYRTGAGMLGRFFSTTVVDCGAGIGTQLHRGVLSSAHAQVFVVPGTEDGAVTVRKALAWLRTDGHDRLLAHTTLALVAHTPNPDTDLDHARELLASDRLPVVLVPFDRHLATGTAIAPDRVGAATHAAVTRIAAQSFAHAQAAP